MVGAQRAARGRIRRRLTGEAPTEQAGADNRSQSRRAAGRPEQAQLRTGRIERLLLIPRDNADSSQAAAVDNELPLLFKAMFVERGRADDCLGARLDRQKNRAALGYARMALLRMTTGDLDIIGPAQAVSAAPPIRKYRPETASSLALDRAATKTDKHRPAEGRRLPLGGYDHRSWHGYREMLAGLEPSLQLRA